MNKRYILDEGGTPQIEPDLRKWAEWFDSFDCQIVRHKIGDVEISTVFLGLDHQYGDGPPLLYETMIFGGPLDCEMRRRYATEDEARKGHCELVDKVSAMAP